MKWVHPFLGVQGYGCIRAEIKTGLRIGFGRTTACAAMPCAIKRRYAIQNRLQEGQAYHLTIRQGNGDTGRSLTRPDAQGVINAVSGNSITVDGMHLPAALCLKSAHEPAALSFCRAFSPAGSSEVMHRCSAMLRISGLLRRCIIRRFTVFPVSAPCKTCSEPP